MYHNISEKKLFHFSEILCFIQSLQLRNRARKAAEPAGGDRVAMCVAALDAKASTTLWGSIGV